jgi:hypothetical protein
LYTARAVFLGALRQIAEHAEKPAAALAALEEASRTLDEADDFAGGAPQVRPSDIAAGHRSAAAETLPPQSTASRAVKHYGQFAAERLAAGLCPSHQASSRQASQALFGMGRVHALLAEEPASTVRNAAAKAEAYYAAAVRADAANWQAANELGVLLARQGRYAEAAAQLRQSIAVQPRPESMHNLAVALHCAGYTAQATQAHLQALALGYGRSVSPRPDVQWVSPDAMAGVPQGPPATHASTPARKPAEPAAKVVEKPSLEHRAVKTEPRVADHRSSRPKPEAQPARQDAMEADEDVEEPSPPVENSPSRLGEMRPRDDESKPADMPNDEADEAAATEADDPPTSPVKRKATSRPAQRRGVLRWLPWNSRGE